VDIHEWLLKSDPAIGWQTMRDLTDASSAAVTAARASVPRQGLVAAILACQYSDGSWRRAGLPVWLPTLFTMQLLRSAGVARNEPAIEAAISRLQTGLGWDDQGGWNLRPGSMRSFFEGEVEPCINGGVLALGGYFGRPTEGLARRLLGEQLEDGGWNCDAPTSARSSFHTTICVLEGLLEYGRAVGDSADIAAARRHGEEYLLERFLFRRRSTGEVANPEFLQLAFPPRYHYDILRALDYFREAGLQPDPRMREAAELIASKQQADGYWILERAYDDVLAIGLGEEVGKPSRWITLRALRALRWFELKTGRGNGQSLEWGRRNV
jgi:hypothetical protein